MPDIDDVYFLREYLCNALMTEATRERFLEVLDAYEEILESNEE